MKQLARWLPFLQWPRPNAALLRDEFIAALTLVVVMIPQSVAYAGLAGMPLVTGLYAALVPTLLAVLFSQSTRLSVGPTALTCLLITASLTGLAAPGSEQWVLLGVWLALISGAMQLAVGASGSAWLLNLVSSPVLAGFTQAAALLIIASQIPALTGTQGPVSRLLSAPPANLETLGYGLVSLALFEAGKRLAPRVPVVLIVLIIAAVLSAVTGYETRGSIIGNLPAGLPAPYWPGLLAWEQFAALLAPAAVIAMVSSLEMASSAKIENQRDGRRWNANQDLIGQGIGKLASAFSGSFATSASFSRSAINLQAGTRTGWSAIWCVLLILAALLFLMPAFYHVPSAVLAAIVVSAVLGLIRPRLFISLWRLHRVEAAIALVTFAVTLATAPRIYWGVLTGVLLGLAHFLHHRLHPRIIEVGLHPDGSLRDRHRWNLAPIAPGTLALRMDDELDFASASALERAVVEHLAQHPQVRHVCLFAHPINRIDATGVEVFMQLRRYLESRDITLHVSGLKLPVERMLERAGALEQGPMLRLYRTDVEALVAFGRHSA